MKQITLRLGKEKADCVMDEIKTYVSDVAFDAVQVCMDKVDVTFHVPDFRMEVFCLNLIHAGERFTLNQFNK